MVSMHAPPGGQGSHVWSPGSSLVSFRYCSLLQRVTKLRLRQRADPFTGSPAAPLTAPYPDGHVRHATLAFTFWSWNHPPGQSSHTPPPSLAYLPLSHTSQELFPSVLDHPAGQETHVCEPLSNLPGTHGCAALHTPFSLQLDAVHPSAMGTEADRPAAIVPGLGFVQLGWPSSS